MDWSKGIDEAQQNENMKMMGKQILESIANGALNNKNCTYKEIKSRIRFIDENPEQFFTTLYTYIKPSTFGNI